MPLTPATITNQDTKEQIKCLFNPTEYTIAKTISWTPKPVVGKNVPRVDFVGGGARTLSLELFFDVYEKEGADVSDHVNKLWALTMIDENEKNPSTGHGRPPFCLFQWGGTWHFKAVVTSLSVKYTLFRQDGTPVRATATVSLQEADEVLPGTNPTSYAEPGHRRRVVEPHDSLPLIAYQEYGDAGKWRKIAEANRLTDPSAITPGQILAIPPV